MALQSEVSPHLVGDPNKDTQIEGDTKSEESSQSTDEDIDLEEGEILDSGEEAEKKDFANSSLKEALDIKCLKSIEQLVSQAKANVSPPNTINKNISPHGSPHGSPHKVKKRPRKDYLDQDRFENNSDLEDGWYPPKHKASKFDDKPIDYRKELEAYRGTPPSSPDSKHREKRKKRSSKKSKKSSKRGIKRKDLKGGRSSAYIKEAMRLKTCKFFKEGNCAKGADCGFSHASPHSYKKKELCKFYLSGHCNKGNDCTYMHGEFPCKFYHTGSECYAKEACRFSHAPLTEETENILADYLHISRGDDDYDRKRRSSPSPEPKGPPPKRTCLLGSPPRHIREAEETKRWQEEMLLQQQNHPGFKIHLGSSRENTPPPFTKPNFYQETLPNTPSPQKRRLNPDATNNSLSTSFPPPSSAGGFSLSNEPHPQRSPERYMYDEDYRNMDGKDYRDIDARDYHNMDGLNTKQESEEFSWTNMRGGPPVKNEMDQFNDTDQQEPDFTSDVKFDETTQFSEMESSVDCNTSSPPNSYSQTIKQESEEENSNHEVMKSEDKATDDSSSMQDSSAAPIISSIVIPSHLPKKQQELLKRVYQHQKKNALAASSSDASNSPKSSDNAESLLKEPEDPVEKTEIDKKDSLWYSSEDDEDDDDNDPLTDVLKKLQKEPPSVKAPAKGENKAAANIMAMLNKVQKNTIEKIKGTSGSQQSDFFTNLIFGSASPTEKLQLPGLNPSSNEPKRRTLLPNPEPIVKKEPIVAPKDPRLKNRDPRTVSSTVNNLPQTVAIEPPVSQTSSQENKPCTFLNTANAVKIEPVKDDIPYKLHGIITKPPNYTPYITASQSNPNLLKDPRLRKHLNIQNNENGVDIKKETECKKITPKDVPPMPKLLLEYNKHASLNINIFESKSAPKPVMEEAQNIKPDRPILTDPRMRRRDSQNSSEAPDTPPHLTIIENTLISNKLPTNLEDDSKSIDNKKWTIPALEKSWHNPPVLEPIWNTPVKQEVDSDADDPTRLEIDESPQSSSMEANNEDTSVVVTKKVKPTPASHLPRAIADPRMAKLHKPLEPRRLRVHNPDCSNKNVELKKNNSPPNENSEDSSKTLPDSTVIETESVKSNEDTQQKLSSKASERKKTIHRNRKSSLDYASPLNSCDDSNSSKSLNYNSYNQRPPRTVASYPVSDSSVSNNFTNSILPETTPDFFSDNSNIECDSSSDVNLKDMFKTIDPTASPFC